MPDQTKRLNVRIPVQMWDGLRELAAKYNTDQSKLVRFQVAKLLRSNEEELPDHVLIESELMKSKKESNPFKRAAHLCNNMHEESREQLLKPFPMPPDEFREYYMEKYEEVIEVAYRDDPEKLREYKCKLKYTINLYEYLHPETDADESELIDAASHHAKAVAETEDMDEARDFVNRLLDIGVLEERMKHEVLDRTRDMKREDWQTEWRESMSPHLAEGDD